MVLMDQPDDTFFMEENNDDNDEKVDINRTDGTSGGTADFWYRLRSTNETWDDGPGRLGTTSIRSPAAARLVLSLLRQVVRTWLPHGTRDDGSRIRLWSSRETTMGSREFR